MTFSGSFEPNIVITKVRKMLYKLGLELNNNKICIIHNSSCQNVTGLVVNEKIQVSVNYRRKLRQEIYYINKFGLKSHLKKLNIKNERKYLNYCLKNKYFTKDNQEVVFLIILLWYERWWVLNS